MTSTISSKNNRQILRNTSDGLLPFLELKLKCFFCTCSIELLFIFLFIACRSRILQCVEFKIFCSFAVCSVLLFFHNWIPPEWSLPRLFSVVCLRLYLIFSLKKWAYLKYERVLLYSNDRLIGFSSPRLPIYILFLYKVVSCCINVNIWSERLD